MELAAICPTHVGIAEGPPGPLWCFDPARLVFLPDLLSVEREPDLRSGERSFLAEAEAEGSLPEAEGCAKFTEAGFPEAEAGFPEAEAEAGFPEAEGTLTAERRVVLPEAEAEAEAGFPEAEALSRGLV